MLIAAHFELINRLQLTGCRCLEAQGHHP
jgi:hypothetical protein